MNDDLIVAKWTPEQVETLKLYQRCQFVHPYTCPNRTDLPHTHTNGDLGQLRPTEDGLVCDDCDYVQTWAVAEHASKNFLDIIEGMHEYYNANFTRGS